MYGFFSNVRSTRDVLAMVLAVVVVSVALSMGLTYLVTSGENANIISSALTIAVAVPMIVAPVISFMLIDSMRTIIQLKEKVEQLANIDVLTGLSNRRRFFEQAQAILCGSARPVCGSVILIDLDHFKQMNDQYGHAIGDRVLAAAGEAIAGSARHGIDIVGRIGGEEFAVLMPGAPVEMSAVLAERMRLAVAGLRIPASAGEISLTASFGASPIAAGECLNVALHRADIALYAAKAAGRNRVETSAASTPCFVEPASGNRKMGAGVTLAGFARVA